MAIDEVGICNSALRHFNNGSILSLSDNSVAANLCNQFYSESRDECLALAPWSFAQKRAILNQNATVPVWGFDYAYKLPADYIGHVKMLDGGDYDYHIEENNLVTDNSSVKIKYTAKITDVGRFPAWFKRLVTSMLAYKLALPLTNSGSVHDRMEKNLYQIEMDAFTADAQEGSGETYVNDDLINSR